MRLDIFVSLQSQTTAIISSVYILNILCVTYFLASIIVRDSCLCDIVHRVNDVSDTSGIISI